MALVLLMSGNGNGSWKMKTQRVLIPLDGSTLGDGCGVLA
jgi:hypothetical protein